MAFIIKPLVTEKMTKITDKSSVEKTYRGAYEEGRDQVRLHRKARGQ